MPHSSTAQQAISLRDALAGASLQCERRPTRIVPDSDKQARSRLGRCLAFGQFLKPTPLAAGRYGQCGLYGTAACLELLSVCPEAALLGSNQIVPEKTKHWAQVFLSTWNFVDLVCLELRVREDLRVWKQLQNTLRLAHLLRSLARAAPNFVGLSDPEKLEAVVGSEVGIIEDLRGDFSDEAVTTLATTVFLRLAGNRIPSEECTIESYQNHDIPSKHTYLYASNGDEVPASWEEWGFVQGSVLAAGLRALRSGLISSEAFLELTDRQTVSALVHICSIRGAYPDDQFRVFILWSLSHLVCDDGGVVPDLPFDSPVDPRWWSQCVTDTVQRLTRTRCLSDHHRHYHGVLSTASGTIQEYTDYFVVPVWPIALYLVARACPDVLCQRPFVALLQDTLGRAGARVDSLGVPFLPFQFGHINGSVNAIYFWEAMNEVARVVGGIRPPGLLARLIGRLTRGWHT